MQKNRKTLVNSYSLEVPTVQKLEHVIESHFANKMWASDFVSHAINDMVNKIEYSEPFNTMDANPSGRWG